MVKGVMSRGFRHVLIQTILKLLVGNSTHAQHYLWTTKGRRLIRQEKTNHAINIDIYTEDARKQLKWKAGFSLHLKL